MMKYRKERMPRLKSPGRRNLENRTSPSEKRTYDEVLELFDLALPRHPDHPDIWRERGALLSNLARYEEAVLSFDRVVAL